MIRIRTKVGDRRVVTLFHNGEWVTLFGSESLSASTLLDAGQNHLHAAAALLAKNSGSKYTKDA